MHTRNPGKGSFKGKCGDVAACTQAIQAGEASKVIEIWQHAHKCPHKGSFKGNWDVAACTPATRAGEA